MKSIASTPGRRRAPSRGSPVRSAGSAPGAMSIASIFGNGVNSNFVKDLAMFPLRYITGATDQARNMAMGVSTTLGGQMYATGRPRTR